MTSMSPRWLSEKLCADAAPGRAQTASANKAETSRRNEGIGKSSFREIRFRKRRPPVDGALVALRRLGGDDVVGPDPTGGTDGETGLGPRGQFARGLVVAAKIGGLSRGQIGLRVISFSAIGHGELHEAQRRLVLACHRRPQNPDRLLGIRLIL